MWPDQLQFVEYTAPTAAENVAADEELLSAVDEHSVSPLLRVWEQASRSVIVGRSNVIEQEVNVAACEADGVPILRRCSGGGAVVLGAGCLCYSLVLPISEQHRQWGVSVVTANIMERLARALSRPAFPVSVQGVSDLVISGRKFSGNSQRWRRTALLHHGTVLYNFDLEWIDRYLQTPSRMPEYRSAREHRDFVCNLDLPRAEILARLREAWSATAE